MKRIWAALPLICLAVLAGCGGSGSSTTTASTPTAPPLTGQVKQQIDQTKPLLGSPSQVPKSASSAAASFGSEAPAAEKEAAAKVLTAYLAALGKGDTTTACALLSPIFAEHLALIASHGQAGAKAPSSADCPAAFKTLLPRLPKDRTHLAQPRLLSLRTNNGHAIAIFTSGGKPYSIPMLKSGSDWKVATIIPAQLSG